MVLFRNLCSVTYNVVRVVALDEPLNCDRPAYGTIAFFFVSLILY